MRGCFAHKCRKMKSCPDQGLHHKPGGLGRKLQDLFHGWDQMVILMKRVGTNMIGCLLIGVPDILGLTVAGCVCLTDHDGMGFAEMDV